VKSASVKRRRSHSSSTISTTNEPDSLFVPLASRHFASINDAPIRRGLRSCLDCLATTEAEVIFCVATILVPLKLGSVTNWNRAPPNSDILDTTTGKQQVSRSNYVALSAPFKKTSTTMRLHEFTLTDHEITTMANIYRSLGNDKHTKNIIRDGFKAYLDSLSHLHMDKYALGRLLKDPDKNVPYHRQVILYYYFRDKLFLTILHDDFLGKYDVNIKNDILKLIAMR